MGQGRFFGADEVVEHVEACGQKQALFGAEIMGEQPQCHTGFLGDLLESGFRISMHPKEGFGCGKERFFSG
ncbi:hypothetical protein TDMWS_15920 [Thermodesulfomicrobium sp. WS]|nr:hypothetical protein TDMWS_15920 [Thermodesulfomicrobium sp. WS]